MARTAARSVLYGPSGSESGMQPGKQNHQYQPALHGSHGMVVPLTSQKVLPSSCWKLVTSLGSTRSPSSSTYHSPALTSNHVPLAGLDLERFDVGQRVRFLGTLGIAVVLAHHVSSIGVRNSQPPLMMPSSSSTSPDKP
jgi:hypothetical protein